MSEDKPEEDLHIKRCKGCPSFDQSRLAGHGYCLEGRTPMELSRLLNSDSPCMFLVGENK